jgi:DNA polymerase-3 subunit gamma/tau
VIEQSEAKPSPISSHSLAAIKAKRAQLTQSKKEILSAEKRNTPISLSALEHELLAYAESLEKSGQKILSTNFELAKCMLDIENNVLTLEVPNATIQKELQMASADALSFLRDRLSNDALQFAFQLSKESTTTEYAYTPEEKYQKLTEKYPQVEAFRKHFNLDL